MKLLLLRWKNYMLLLPLVYNSLIHLRIHYIQYIHHIQSTTSFIQRLCCCPSNGERVEVALEFLQPGFVLSPCMLILLASSADMFHGCQGCLFLRNVQTSPKSRSHIIIQTQSLTIRDSAASLDHFGAQVHCTSMVVVREVQDMR